MTPAQREAAARLIEGPRTSSVLWGRAVAALLRELLAEPPAWSGDPSTQDYASTQRELLAEPQSEPVAWMHDGFVSTNFERVKHDESRNLASGFKAKPIIPLYAHPPQQRKPLTERQIVSALADAGCCGTVKLTYDSGPYEVTCATAAAIDLVRAIERAHGIGGKE